MHGLKGFKNLGDSLQIMMRRAEWSRTGGGGAGSALGAAALPLPAPSLPPLPGLGVPAAAAGVFVRSAACGAGCRAAALLGAAAVAGLGDAAKAVGFEAGGSAAPALAARALPDGSVAVAEAVAAGLTAAPALASLGAGTVGAPPVADFALGALVCLFSFAAGVANILAPAAPPDPAWLKSSQLSQHQDKQYAKAPARNKALTCHSSILSEDMQLHQWQRSGARQRKLQDCRVASHLAHQGCRGGTKRRRQCMYDYFFCLTNLKAQLLHVTTVEASVPFQNFLQPCLRMNSLSTACKANLRCRSA